MYPAFKTTRPRLPSVLSVYEPIEQYQADLRKRGCLRGNTETILGPLDAYLIHLLVNVHPGEPAIVDLIAEATTGASTLLGLLHPRQPHVHAFGGSVSGDRRTYRSVMEDYLRQQEKDLSCLQCLPHAEPVAELRELTDAFVFVAGDKPGVDAEVEQWLSCLPSAIVVVFGLGPVGDCAGLDALLRRFPTGSPHRLTLLRESGEALSASRIGIVAQRDNPAAESALRRLRQLFTSNYSILGLLRSATEQAIRASTSDKTARESIIYFHEWNQEINRLKKAAHEAGENNQAAAELHAIKSRFTYRLSERFHRWRQQIAPDQTRRYRLLQRLRRAAQILRHEGIFSLLRRLIRRG